MKKLLLILSIAFAGCVSDAPPATGPATAQGTFFNHAPGLFGDRHPDAPPPMQILVQVHVWKLLVPVGTVSKSEAFWKHVDEHAVDPLTYETLSHNGVRVGIAPTSDWEYFRKIIAAQPAVTQRMELSATAERGAEIEMRTRVPYQVLNYMDNTGYVSGRTYDQCDDILVLAFKPAPRKLGDVRISLCPMVRSTRTRLDFTAMDHEMENSFEDRDHLYDLNLIANVSLGDALIVAPSPSADLPTSLGSIFLTRAGDAERFEQVLLMVPEEFREQSVDTPGR